VIDHSEIVDGVNRLPLKLFWRWSTALKIVDGVAGLAIVEIVDN